MNGYNERILKSFLEAAASGKAANAYLLSGGTREAREEFAERFARSLIDSPADLIYPQHEKERLFSVEDVRSEINSTAAIRPYGTKKKVYLVKDADLMNVQAENALLKTLEEPPEFVVILLLGENQSVFLPTILSRSVKIILSEEDAAENGGEPEESATGAFLKKGPNATESDVIALSRRFKKEKSAKKAADDPKEAIEEVRAWLRRALGVKTRAESGSYELKRAADALSYEKLNELLAAVETADERILRNVDGELTMGVLFRTIRNAYEVKE